LTATAIEEARLGGFHYIWLLIAKKDQAAQRWLLKQGFRIAWQDEREIQFMRSTMSG
jgi:ribosomal protein S18 acetylase RimI-like enzyme